MTEGATIGQRCLSCGGWIVYGISHPAIEGEYAERRVWVHVHAEDWVDNPHRAIPRKQVANISDNTGG